MNSQLPPVPPEEGDLFGASPERSMAPERPAPERAAAPERQKAERPHGDRPQHGDRSPLVERVQVREGERGGAVAAPASSGRTEVPSGVGGGASSASATAAEPHRDVPLLLDELRPREIVRRLDEFIIGQPAAKRAVAVALRNRYRRQRLPEDLRHEVLPKNILMIGPTGVGKTEIARRLARLTNSPFIKVEATKFTEVGYVGRDVESIVRDLLEQTITEVQNDRVAAVEERARELAEARILDALVAAEAHAGQTPGAHEPDAEPTSATPPPPGHADAGDAKPAPRRPGDAGQASAAAGAVIAADPVEHNRRRLRALRRRLARRLALRQLEDQLIDIELEEQYQPAFETFGSTGMEDVGMSLSDFFSQMAPPRKRMKRLSVADARAALVQEETDHLVDIDRVYDDSIHLVEEAGIVFIDEIDKICGPASEHGPDISGQGVQRDLLPILEGSTVHTRYGAVHTDHILFVGAGAFTASRPSELIPEFQGRFPIRVELTPLTEADLRRILVEPNNALTRQYVALLATEDVTLEFTEDGVDELAHQAHAVNERDENIGARRLFTVVEKVLEDISFDADEHAGESLRIDREMVRLRLADLVRNDDLRRYVL